MEPIIKVRDLAWVRLRSPDLDVQEQFLTAFGLGLAERTADKLFMRGTDGEHHLHITEKGPAKVLAIAYHAESAADLARLAREAGATVQPLNEPGGGDVVRLVEPNGYTIEVVHGVAKVASIPVETIKLNSGAERRRLGDLMRVDVKPSRVKRIGHAVLSTPEVEKTALWFRRHLGFVATDEVHVDGDPTTLVASFNRMDHGSDYVDHHVAMFARYKKPGFNHVSYEVQDLDDLQCGHEHLGAKGYNHLWGIGRHLLGSQIFDYWQDPWGRVHEHWTDSDLVNDTHQYRKVPPAQGLRSQWGPGAPQAFRDAAAD